ncbi:hypothetical protein NHQ30_001401 [Ciborinia camelliae]|nr:hypothetical protein NHQ30_001401 [Ciborinia camelliae]
MSRVEYPPLKRLFDTTFAFKQAVSKRMSSSTPLPFKPHPSLFSLQEVPGPATELLTDFFDDMNKLNMPQPLDSSYIILSKSHHVRSPTRHETSTPGLSTNTPNIPDQPPTSPTSLSRPSGSSSDFQYSRPHVNSAEDLQELASKFKKIHNANAQLIGADSEYISNSLPNLKLRPMTNPSKVYEEEFKEALDKEKKTFESNIRITGSKMRKQIPKLHISPFSPQEIDRKEKGKATSDGNEMEENAVGILEDLFGELEKRDNGMSEDEWMSADEIIAGAKRYGRKSKNKNQNKKSMVKDEETNRATGINILSREIDIYERDTINEDEEINDYEEKTIIQIPPQKLHEVPQKIDSPIASASAPVPAPVQEQSQEQPQSNPQPEPQTHIQTTHSSSSSSIQKFPEEKSTQSPLSLHNLHDLHTLDPNTSLPKMQVSNGVQKQQSQSESQSQSQSQNQQEQEHHSSTSEKSIKSTHTLTLTRIDTSTHSNTNYSTFPEPGLDMPGSFPSVASNIRASRASSTASSSTSSTASLTTDGGVQLESEKPEPEVEMAALASAVLLASLWMIERRIGA